MFLSKVTINAEYKHLYVVMNPTCLSWALIKMDSLFVSRSIAPFFVCWDYTDRTWAASCNRTRLIQMQRLGSQAVKEFWNPHRFDELRRRVLLRSTFSAHRVERFFWLSLDGNLLSMNNGSTCPAGTCNRGACGHVSPYAHHAQWRGPFSSVRGRR